MIILIGFCFLCFCAYILYLFNPYSKKTSRERFEAWYISKFLNVMGNAQAAVIELRNDFGGYDDPHIDGAWEGWQISEHGIDLQCHVKVSAAQAFVFILLIMAITGLLYWVCFSPSFYTFIMSFSEV